MATLATGLLEIVIGNSRASSVVTTVGTNLIIGTMATTTTSIGSVIKYLVTSNQPGMNEIINVLTMTDLEYTVNVIQQVIREQECKQLHESIIKALMGVGEILNKINGELESIKYAMDYHQTKYFSSWRSFTWNGNLETIKQHNNILKHRYTILFELLKIYG